MKGTRPLSSDMAKTLGGKITSSIPNSRVPKEWVEAEVERAAKVLPHVHLQQELKRKEFEELREEYDYVVLATGAQKPRVIPGARSRAHLPGPDLPQDAKQGKAKIGKKLVIIARAMWAAT